MHGKMKKIYLIIIMAIACVSCSKWLDVKPYDKISHDELYSTESGFIKHLNGIYVELNSDMLYGSTLSIEMVEVMGGAYVIGTDKSVWGNYQDLAGYEYGTQYWRARLNETWNKAYSLILNCNLLLESLESTDVLFTGDKGRDTGAESNAPF